MNNVNYAYFRPGWTPFTVLAMVLGFMVFWPLGLAVLAYILWGERFGWSSDTRDRWINKQKQWASWCQNSQSRRGSGFSSWGQGPTSGNAAFDAYREEQLKRLDEERRRLDEEVHEFHEYLRNLHMARDREEFDRFMRDRQSRQNTPTSGENSPPTNV
ncbi:MAG: DUF2852 domain-containing protein [Devosia sp.]|jgi:hypothetical protein|nr:DUF2852 domain-containing protein [Devosiaceae bacterium]